MKSIDLKANVRKDIGKKSTKALRKDGNVPCVMYGGEEIVHFYAPQKTFKPLIYTPDVYLINLDIDGKAFKVIIKDIQFHPVTDVAIHIDFMQVIDGKPVDVLMPVVLEGSSIGVKNGGKIRIRRRKLLVRGIVEKIPDTIVLDITKLDIGDTIQVMNINIDDLVLLDPPRAMVMGIVSSRVSAKGMELVEEGAEGEEGAESEEGAEAAAEEKSE